MQSVKPISNLLVAIAIFLGEKNHLNNVKGGSNILGL